jgi:uncharacterized membrane protein
MFPFDIFGFISGFIVLIFVIAIIVFVVVILIIYKLLHTNVENEKKSKKLESTSSENIYRAKNDEVKEKFTITKEISTCKYCGEKIDENALFCPLCGSNLN